MKKLKNPDAISGITSKVMLVSTILLLSLIHILDSLSGQGAAEWRSSLLEGAYHYQ